jgi:hypothetical protein
MTEQKEHIVITQPQQESGLAIASLILGVVSMTGPGLLLGIPAIITGAIALKRKLAGRGLAIAGLVTGIISTVISILFILFIAFMVILSITMGSSDNGNQYNDPAPSQRYQQMQS